MGTGTIFLRKIVPVPIYKSSRTAASRPKGREAITLSIPEDHGVKDQQYNHDPDAQEKEPEDVNEFDEAGRQFGENQTLLQLSFFFLLRVIPGPIEAIFIQRNQSGEDHPVHREPFGTEMGIEKVNRKNKSGGQQRLVAVNDRGHVDQPARKDQRGNLREPEHQTRQSDDRNAPE